MANVLLLLTVSACVLGTWAPIVVDLVGEFRYHRDHNPVPSRRRQRVARRAAAAMRARVGASPEHAVNGTGSSRLPRVTGARRDMPAAGTRRVTVPAAGPHAYRGRAA